MRFYGYNLSKSIRTESILMTNKSQMNNYGADDGVRFELCVFVTLMKIDKSCNSSDVYNLIQMVCVCNA